MMRQWAIALACAGCLMATTSAQAQWGLQGQDADPRYDSNVAGDAAAEACMCMPGVDITAGYLSWWLRSPNLTTSLAAGAGGNIGPDSFDYNTPFSGAEVRARFWLDNTQTGSFEVGGFILAERSDTAFAIGAAGTGGTIASAASFLWGADANLIVNTLSPVDLIGGFRYLDLKEDLNITTAAAAGGGTFDHFYARNEFYGGQIGARACYRRGLFTFTVQGLLGLGDNHESILVAGTTTAAGAGGAITPGGTFATAANSGAFTRDEFSVLVDAGGRIGFDITGGVQVYVGYNFLYLSDAVRPFNQVTPPAAAVAGAAPSVPFNSSYFWAQGLSVGLNVRY
jgi:hypothetical protein